MDKIKINAQADYISMDLTNRVLNQTLSIGEAMYSLILATTYLLSRTLPKPAYDNELDNAKVLAHEVIGVVNSQIKKHPNLSPAGIMLSFNLVMELLMEDMNRS